MKRYDFYLMAVLSLCAACSQNNIANKEPELSSADGIYWGDSVAQYRQGVAQGDSSSYLKLARCYHDGRGVNRSYPDMLKLLVLAAEKGFVVVDEYMKTLSEDDDFRLLYDAMVDIKFGRISSAHTKAMKLKRQGVADWMFMEAVVLYHQKREAEAQLLLEKGTLAGSQLASMALEDIAKKR